MILAWLQRKSAVRPPKFVTAGLLLLLAGAAFPVRASAQSDLLAILANLTPYNQTQRAYLTATCEGELCRMPFAVVPAGKRLLVTGVSLNTYDGTSNNLDAVLTNGLTDYGSPDYHQINLPGGLVVKNDSSGFGYTMSWGGLVSFYIDEGHVPTFVYNGSFLTNEYAGEGTITGFLIPMP